jgi:dipeptidyl aminopeptidase/acylaminoacyl peptidase
MRALPCGIILLSAWGLAVACGRDTTEPVPGTLELTLSTTGLDLDPDGYTVTVDAGNPIPAPTNGTVTLPDLSPGRHTVTLAGLATNCTSGTPPSVQVSIPEDKAARFEVTCSAIYTLAYQGSSGVELTDAAGTVHRTLVPDAYLVAWSPDGRLLAVRDVGLVGSGIRVDRVWLVSPEDGGLREFASSIYLLTVGAWSPDGRELLLEGFAPSNSCPTVLARYPLDHSFSPQEVYRASGGLACSGGGLKGITWADWSPDGSQIVVHEAVPVPDNGPQVQQIYVISRDGTAKRVLAEGRQPDWSPNGSAIVYATGPFYGRATLHLVNPDGSNDRQLTSPALNETDEEPAWSPDGSKVAFVRLGLAPDSTVTSVHAYVIDADGTNEHQLAVLPGDEPAHPAWSPHGLHLVYSGYGGTYVVDADGSGFRLVSNARAATVLAQWRP